MVGVLLDSGADVNYENKKGNTALIYASICGHTEVVKLLLYYGADTERREQKIGVTALSIAAAKGYAEIVDLLLENGADTKVGKLDIALNYAQRKGNKDVVMIVKKHTAYSGSAPLVITRSVTELIHSTI